MQLYTSTLMVHALAICQLVSYSRFPGPLSKHSGQHHRANTVSRTVVSVGCKQQGVDAAQGKAARAQAASQQQQQTGEEKVEETRGS